MIGGQHCPAPFRFRNRRGVLAGTAKYVAIVAAGVLAVLALPPFSFLPALAAFSALYTLSAAQGFRSGFLGGYLFGAGFFAVGLSWISESFFVEADRFGWMAVLAVLGLSAFLALFPAAACGAFGMSKEKGFPSAVLFAACWTGLEWLRGHLLTGFPWNLAGYAFADYAPLRQAAAYVGAYGLSFLVVLLAALAAVAVTARTRRDRMAAISSLAALAVVAFGAGQIRLMQAEPNASGPTVRVVQANVPQRLKWDPAYREEIVRRYLELSQRPGDFDLLLWPETAFPGYLEESPAVLDAMASTLPRDAFLLTGSPDREQRGGETAYRNAVLAIDNRGSVIARYYKHHLVPFGEYVPLKQWLPIERLTAGAGAFTPGSGPKTLRLGSLPAVGLSICYEAIFPGHVLDSEGRPAWMFNATNDAWFGTSIGPWQHLASARMRTVEEGLPMVRAANTGISVVFDAYGRTVDRLELQETGAMDVTLPAPLQRTPYSRFADWLLLPLMLVTWTVAHFASVPPNRRNER